MNFDNFSNAIGILYRLVLASMVCILTIVFCSPMIDNNNIFIGIFGVIGFIVGWFPIFKFLTSR